MEIIYVKIHYYLFMERSFKKLFEYQEKFSGADERNFNTDLLGIQDQLCKIFDKMVDIEYKHEGRVLFYIAYKQDLDNPSVVVSQTSIIQLITRSFSKGQRTSAKSIYNALNRLKEKEYIIDIKTLENKTNLKLNLEKYPELRTLIELVSRWKFPSKYGIEMKKHLTPKPQGRVLSRKRS